MQKYFLGLDIGTNSCGWAVTDEEYKLIRRKGVDLWGVRLFENAETAVDRRQNRTNRRRLDRQKLKLSWVRDIFSQEIAKVDPCFLTRIKYSNLWEEDKYLMSNALKSKDSLFNCNIDGRKYTDKDYFNEYPTIYHLRQQLTQTPAKDVRFLYLAVHNIIKHRGHFLYEGEFGENSDIKNLFDEIKEIINNQGMPLPFDLKQIDNEDISKLIAVVNERKGIKYTKSKFYEIFDVKNKNQKSFVGTLVDGKLNVKQIFDIETEIEKLDFASEEIDNDIDKLSEGLSEEIISIIQITKKIYSTLQLKSILGNNEYICDAMVESYEIHHNQLKDFKTFIRNFYPEKYFNIFRNSRFDEKQTDVGYAQYVKGNLVGGKKQVTNLYSNSTSREEFYKYIKKILNNIPEKLKENEKFLKNREEILSLIESNAFLIKQRSKANSVFPNKLYEKELQQILEVNSAKFEFLKEFDSEAGLTNKEKLLEILRFRVPYFVGPIGANENGQNHSWVTKNKNIDYKPWTLNQIVNFDEAENAFIERMTNKCTYLKDKEVLPKNAIVYSKFRVLNELNKLKINGMEISVDLKQDIFVNLFEKFPKVTSKMVKRFLVAEGLFDNENEITISGIDKEFANNFASYSKFATNTLFGKDFVDDNIDAFEKIIKYHTIISDKQRLESRIRKEFNDLFSEEQFKYLKGLNFNDWGRLSYEFLVDLKFVDSTTGEILCIMDVMWDTNQNLMQILNNPNYNLREKIYQNDEKNIKNLTYQDVEQLYCSPAVKRGVWQTLKIIKEIVSVMGEMPEKIFVEVTRDDEQKGDAGRKSSRKKNLENFYKTADFKNNNFITANDIAKLLEELNHKDVSEFRSEKLYLYFLQAGKCIYSGESIDIKDIFNDNKYDVDHIIPQSIIKDDSINNKVLVKSELNRAKDNNPISAQIVNKQKEFWNLLNKNKLMSDEKLGRLLRVEPWTDEELGGFIARQLVETNQTVKSVIDCLKSYVDNPRNVIYSKASFVAEFRNNFEIFKCRMINDLHHAQDAYLNVIVGNVINSRFTDNPANFYKVVNKNQKVSKNIKKIFNGIVYSPLTNKPVWDVKDIGKVKKTCARTSPIISEMSYSNLNGAFYKETLHKNKENSNGKSKASVPQKGDSLNPLNNFERYGGYNDLFNAYFIVVDSKDKKGNTIRTIESVPILIVRKYIGKPNFDENILSYVAKENNLVEPQMFLNRLNFESTLLIGNGRYFLGGKSGDQYVLHNANQLFVDSKYIRYIKNIEKYLQYVKNKTDDSLPQTEDKIIVSRASKERNTELSLSKDENIELYNYLTLKLSKNVYKNMQLSTVLLPKMNEGYEEFKNLSIKDQIEVLSEILNRTARGARIANLSKIQKGKAVGAITINKNITGKNFILIENSVTGLFEKRIYL